MKIAYVEDLYLSLLQSLHSCERQTNEALPKLAGAASNKMLGSSFARHSEECKVQLDRLRYIMNGLSEIPNDGLCQTTATLLKEGQELMESDGDEAVRDMGLICLAQRLYHHKIAMYGCLRAYASLIDRVPDVRLLDASLREEREADRWLSILAIGVINDKSRSRKSESTWNTSNWPGKPNTTNGGVHVQRGLRDPSDRMLIERALSD